MGGERDQKEGNGTSPRVSNVPRSKPSGHLIQAFFEGGGLLQGVRRRCCQLRAICRMPLLILLSLGPIRFARAIGGHIEGLYLVDIVVIHAPLGEDILAPRTELPIAVVVSAGREHAVALLQVCRKHSDCRLGDDLKVAEEAILHIRTILVVEAVRRISWLGTQPSPQTLRDEYSISVDLDGIVCRLPLAHLTDLHPDLIEDSPIHPGARVLSLQLVELAETIFNLSIVCRLPLAHL